MRQLQLSGQSLPLLYPEHSDLSYSLDSNGYPRPILTPADWQVRRQHVLAHMQSVLGKLPDRSKLLPLNVQILEEIPIGATAQAIQVMRQKIEYQTEANNSVRAYLFKPAINAKKLPAVLCLHQTVGIGKQEPAGLGGSPNLHYALHLAWTDPT